MNSKQLLAEVETRYKRIEMRIEQIQQAFPANKCTAERSVLDRYRKLYAYLCERAKR